MEKEKERKRKARQRTKLVYCKCLLCNGEQEQVITVAAKHFKLFGANLINEDESVVETVEDLVVEEGGVESLNDSSDFFQFDYSNSPESIPEFEEESDNESTYRKQDDVEDLVKGSYEKCLYDTDRARERLYPGSATTVLEALCRYFSWFTEHPGMSKSCLSNLLSIQQRHVLPSENKLPCSYEQAYTFIQPFLLPLKIFHVCINDCVVFRDCPRYRYKDLLHCPICGASRYIGNSKQARKLYHYYPVGPRWRRMYGDATISAMLQSHGANGHEVNDVMQDIHDAPQFQQAYQDGGPFDGDSRGLSLQFATDGMCPFKHGTYSMWPITLSMLNLPKSVRHLFSSILLVGIVPGQKGDTGMKLDPYLEILVDELLELSGTPMYDDYQKTTFEFKVKILNYVLDYPGLNKLFAAHGANALMGCMWCEVLGRYIQALDKTVYLDNRRYLPEDSVLRKDKSHFPDKAVEKRPPPDRKQLEDILYNSVASDSAPNQTQAKNIAKGLGCKSCYSLMLLEDHDRTSQAFPDIMHTLKNVIVSIIDLITGREDTAKVRKTEEQLRRFSGCYPQSGGFTDQSTKEGALCAVTGNKKKKMNARKSLPDAPFRLTKDELKEADKRAAEVCVPLGFGWKPGIFFTNYSRMKAHDWKEVVTHGIIKYCLRGTLGPDQQQTLFSLLGVLTKLCAGEQSKEGISKLREEVNHVCSLIERDFPISLQVISLHCLRHIVDGIEHQGPTHSWSMWMYERFNSWISRRVLNRSTPEATIMKTYQIYDWCQYMKMSGRVEGLDDLDDYEASYLPLDENQHSHVYSDDQEYTKEKSKTSQSQNIPEEIVHLLNKFYDTSLDANIEITSISREFEVFYKHSEVISGRKIVWIGGEKENPNHYRVSSVVSLKLGPGKPLFGQLRFFFTHTFKDTTRRFAVVNVFNSMSTTQSPDKLWWVDKSRVIKQIVPADSTFLSKPLVTARFSGDANLLCILDYE